MVHSMLTIVLLGYSLAGFARDTDGVLDPTLPSHVQSVFNQAQEEAFSGEYQLTSVLYSQERRIALVNKQLVKEGEVVGDKKVVEILPSQVRLEDGQVLKLNLGSQNVKQLTE